MSLQHSCTGPLYSGFSYPVISAVAHLPRQTIEPLFTEVLQPSREELAHVLIVERVVRKLALSTIFDETHVPQDPQLMTDRGVRSAEQSSQIADTELFNRKGVDDLQPGRMAKDLERFGQTDENVPARHGGRRSCYSSRVYNVVFADVQNNFL